MSDGSFDSHKIKDLILAHMSGPSPTCEERQIANTEEWGLLKTTAVTWQGWDHTAHKVPPPEYWKNYRIEVKAGDVLVTKAGPRHRVGVVAYVDKTPPRLMVSGKMIGLRPDPTKVDYRVLAAALSQQEPQRFLDSRTTGMADSQLNFTNDLLLNTVVKLPPQPEQTKIAEILSTVDCAIEKTTGLIGKHQRIKTGLMQDLLTRGIDKDGNLRTEQTHLFKDSPLGRIPVEWEVRPCGALCRQIVVGIVIRPAQYYKPDGVPVLRSANVKENSIDPSDLVFMSEGDNETLSKSKLYAGDLVTVRTGYPGTTAVVPQEFHGSNCVDLVVSRAHTDRVRPKFLSIWVNSDHGKRQVLEGQGGVAQQHFNVGEMKALLVKVPCLKEQQRIEELLLLQSSTESELMKNLAKLRTLKNALMQDLLSGRKRVTSL